MESPNNELLNLSNNSYLLPIQDLQDNTDLFSFSSFEEVDDVFDNKETFDTVETSLSLSSQLENENIFQSEETFETVGSFIDNDNSKQASKRRRTTNKNDSSYQLYSIENLYSQSNKKNDDEESVSSEDFPLNSFLKGDINLQEFDSKYAFPALKIKKNITKDSKDSIANLVDEDNKLRKASIKKKGVPKSQAEVKDYNKEISFNLRDYIVPHDALANWIEIDTGLFTAVSDWRYAYTDKTSEDYLNTQEYKFLRRFTNYPNEDTKHKAKSLNFTKDKKGKIIAITYIFVCAKEEHNCGKCAHWTKIYGIVDPNNPDKFLFRVYRINEHYNGRPTISPLKSMNLQVKRYIENQNMLYYTASQVLKQMERDANSKDPTRSRLINFTIPDLDQISSYLTRERQRNKQLPTAETKYQIVTQKLKERTCKTIEEIMEKGFDSPGEMIVVHQWENSFKVTLKDEKTNKSYTRIEKSPGFAFITNKYFETFKFIYENDIGKRDGGLCLSIDMVHNLFTSKLCQGTIGIPVLTPFRDQRKTSAYKRKLNESYPIPVITNTKGPHHKLLPLISVVCKSENSEDIMLALHSANKIYYRLYGIEKLPVGRALIDHSFPLALAVEMVYPEPGIDISSCWFHVKQNADKNKNRLKHKETDYYKSCLLKLKKHQEVVQKNLHNSSSGHGQEYLYRAKTALDGNTFQNGTHLDQEEDEVSIDNNQNSRNHFEYSEITTLQNSNVISQIDDNDRLRNELLDSLSKIIPSSNEIDDSDIDEDSGDEYDYQSSNFVVKDNSKQPSTKRNKTFYHTVAKPMIQMVHHSHTLYQFDLFSEVMLELWSSLDEERYATYFGSEYLTGKFHYWGYQASLPGTPCTNNINESLNNHAVRNSLRKNNKESLEKALMPDGYFERCLRHIDMFQTLDNLVIVPPCLSQLEKIASTGIPEKVIHKAASILLPDVANLDGSHSMEIKYPNIKYMKNSEIQSLNIGLEEYIKSNEFYVVLSDNKREISDELALSYLKAIYPSKQSDGNYTIPAIKNIKSIADFCLFYRTYMCNIHLVKKDVCPLYTYEEFLKKTSSLLTYYSDLKNTNKLKFRTVYANELFKKGKFVYPIDATKGEQNYGIIVDVNIKKYPPTVKISININEEPKEFKIEEIIQYLVPRHMYKYVCNCKYYHINAYYCKHIIAVLGLPNENIYRTLELGCYHYESPKRGNPGKKEKALQYRKHYNGLRIVKEETLPSNYGTI